MYEKKRQHYRVAKREIYEDPYEGIYVTKEEARKSFLVIMGLLALSFLTILPLTLRSK